MDHLADYGHYFLLVQGGDLGAEYPPFAIDEHGGWEIEHLGPSGGGEVVGEAQLVDEVSGILLRIQPLRHEQAQEPDVFTLQLLPGPLEGGHLSPAGRAGRVPEIQDHGRFAHLVRQPEAAAIEQGDSEVYRLLNLGGSNYRNQAGCCCAESA